jgi:hypothetical protein
MVGEAMGTSYKEKNNLYFPFHKDCIIIIGQMEGKLKLWRGGKRII